MKSYAMGVDFGSTTAKTVILDLDGNTVAARIESMGAVSGEGAAPIRLNATKYL